jgi:chromate transporter
VWGMARNLSPDPPRASMAVGGALVALLVPSAIGQVAAIVAGGLIGWAFLEAPPAKSGHVGITFSRSLGAASLVAFFALLIGLPFLADATGSHTLALIDSFYRAGSLVFGGGHVVLPLLQQSVVPPGWIDNNGFLAGYGAAQAVPGPIFTFAAYLGAAMHPGPNGVAGGLLCLAAIYLPSFFLLIGVLPFWDALRRRPAVQSALRGINATVVGLLLAALYTPVWTSAINDRIDFAIGIVAFLLLALWKLPPWLVVILGAVATALIG